jgi:hypothetical protein
MKKTEMSRKTGKVACKAGKELGKKKADATPSSHSTWPGTYSAETRRGRRVYAEKT